MQIRSEVSEMLGLERKAANPSAENIAFLSRLQQRLDNRIEPALNSIDSNLSSLYAQARQFTADMYKDLRNQQIMTEVVNTVGRNPEEFRTLATQPHLVTLLKSMEEAFTVGRRIPPGINVPAELQVAPHIWRDVIQPEIRFQLLKETLPDVNHAALKTISNSPAPIQQLINEQRILTPKPGAFLALQNRLGDDTYKTIMGPEGNMLLQVDRALLDVELGRKVHQEVGLVVLQWGGIHLGMTGAGLLASGQTVHGIAGLGLGGLLLFTPGVMNKMLTNPERFERLILGIHEGANDPRVSRMLYQIGTQAAREIGIIPSLRSPDPRNVRSFSLTQP
jgi:hypothetical protein